LKLPFGVLINRADVGDREVHLYCRKERIKVLAEIQDNRRIAEAYSRGEMVCEALPEYQSLFEGLLKEVTKEGQAGVG